MAIDAMEDQGFVRRSSQRDRLEYRLVLSLCFILYLVAATFLRLARLAGPRADEPRKTKGSIFAEANAAAHAAAGYAFMA